MGREVIVDGISYANVAEAARAFGLVPKTVSARLRSDWSIDEAFELKPRQQKLPARRRTITVKLPNETQEFITVKEAAIHFGLDPKVVRARLTSYGWSPEEALGLTTRPPRKPHNRKPVEFTFGGQQYFYDSVSAAAEAFGLNEFLVFNRLNGRKWTIEQALELADPPGHAKTCYGYIYEVTNKKNGKQYVGQTMCAIEERWERHVQAAHKKKPREVSLASAIRQFGRDSFTVREIDRGHTRAELNKLERYWIKRKKTRAPVGYNLNRGGSGQTKGHVVTVDGVTYPSISEAASEYGLRDRLVLDRLRYGWAIEQALDIEAPPGSSKYAGRILEVDIHGKKKRFQSIGELARYFDLSYSRVLQRLMRLGWTPEQAIGLSKPPKWTHPMHAFTLTVSGELRSFVSRAEAAREYGFKRWSTVEKRLRRGWSIEQALDLETAPENKQARKTISVSINGKRVAYESQSAAARAHGVDFKRVSARRNLGWSYEEALEIIPRAKKK